MAEWPILSLLIFLPLVGAAFVLLAPREDAELAARNCRWVALWTSLINLVLALGLWASFDTTTPAFQFVERVVWIDETIRYHVGVDGISMLFVVLTAMLTPICILASWDSVKVRVREYMIAFLVMETMMIGVFCALDFVVFYLFFEGGLIPMFLIIGVWGGDRRVYATFKFFLYTLLGSVLLLVAILVMYFEAGTTDIPTLMAHGFEPGLQQWLWLAFLASFAVKLPMWPLHTWLPDAHVEAPTAGSVILAAVLLKMGGYGFLRFSIPMLPDATATFTPLIFTLSVVAIIYTSLVALMQEDMKKLIAYSSVAHMGFVTIGIFTLTTQGIEGGIFQMLSHGLVSAALFLCVGDHLRPPAHARDRALRRAGAADADLRRHVHGLHPRQRRPARHLGLRRRDPGADRRLQGQHLGRGGCLHRGCLERGLRAVALPPRDLRGHHQGRSARHVGYEPARGTGLVRRCWRRSSCSESIRRRSWTSCTYRWPT